MSRKPKKVLADLMGLVGVALLCQCTSVAARSVLRPHFDERDPMVAMPSGQQPQVAAREVQYVAYQPAGPYAAGPQSEMVVEYPGQTQANQMQLAAEVQTEQYELVQPSGQTEEANCNRRPKLAGIQDREADSGVQSYELNAPADYPGQIVYMNQNGNEADQFKGPAASWSQASDLSATILTEVPVREMSPEVLSKLRRDYGVKVVATRERPGANLVINCEDYSGLDSSICSRQTAGQELAYQPQPVEGVQIESGEPIAMEPRRRISTFHHIEHLVQPSSHHSEETQTEGYQTESRTARAGEVGGQNPEVGEHVVYEAVTVQPGSAYEVKANQEPSQDSQPPTDAPSSATQEAPDSYEGARRSQTDAPVAEAFQRSETQEHQTNLEEQQQNENESNWQESPAERRTPRKETAGAVEWPERDSAKQVAPGELDVSATRMRS